LSGQEGLYTRGGDTASSNRSDEPATAKIVRAKQCEALASVGALPTAGFFEATAHGHKEP